MRVFNFVHNCSFKSFRAFDVLLTLIQCNAKLGCWLRIGSIYFNQDVCISSWVSFMKINFLTMNKPYEFLVSVVVREDGSWDIPELVS